MHPWYINWGLFIADVITRPLLWLIQMLHPYQNRTLSQQLFEIAELYNVRPGESNYAQSLLKTPYKIRRKMQRYRIVKSNGILLNILNRQDTEVYSHVVDDDISYLEVEDDNLWVITKKGQRCLTADHARIYINKGWIVPSSVRAGND